jgi:starch synthase
MRRHPAQYEMVGRMRVLFVTSEVFPLAKTGGLADVAASLPAALTELGVDVRLIVPGYPQALERATHVSWVRSLGRVMGAFDTELLAARLPGSGLPIWLVDCPGLFNRPGGPYQDPHGQDWNDNAQRFAVLNYAAHLICTGAGADDGWRPDIVHGNDWHAGLLPHLLHGETSRRPRSVMTIHNLAYQGVFPYEIAQSLDLPHAEAAFAAGEFYGRFSFLKAGIALADILTTVSPTYGEEIMTSALGCGLDGAIRRRSNGVHGILNGADYAIWDPARDQHLLHNYSAQEVGAKRINKAMLQHELGLDPSEDVPLIAWMSRLAHQKMPDVTLEALPALLEEGVQFALVAEGDGQYEAPFQELAARYPRQVAAHIGYEEPVAHRLLAGADMLLHPARYEPCGLSPIYAMRYGAVPIVRRTGGLADSVTDTTDATLRAKRATGFSFEEPSPAALIEAVQRAVSVFAQPLAWRKIQTNAMRQDFSWKQSAAAYLDLYRKAQGKTGRAPTKVGRKAQRLTA